MNIKETELSGCYICEPEVYEDKRGLFFEGFNETKFRLETGINFKLSQLNCSKSKKGVLRGLHFQIPPFEQAKIVFVTSGEVLDVAVDIRKNSKTFGQHISLILSEENKRRIFIPAGFAHGFVTLSESASLSYLVEGNYSAQHDAGLIFNDKDLNIDWRLNSADILTSEKDGKLPLLRDLKDYF